jgi:hypothetical protein
LGLLGQLSDVLLTVADDSFVVIDLFATLFRKGMHFFDSFCLFFDFGVSAS